MGVLDSKYVVRNNKLSKFSGVLFNTYEHNGGGGLLRSEIEIFRESFPSL